MPTCIACSQRASRLMPRLGYLLQLLTPSKLPFWTYESPDVSLQFSTRALKRSHFRLTVLALFIRVLFGRNQVQVPVRVRVLDLPGRLCRSHAEQQYPFFVGEHMHYAGNKTETHIVMAPWVPLFGTVEPETLPSPGSFCSSH